MGSHYPSIKITILLANAFYDVRISFHHANPDAGNESFLLRFNGEADETPCILVDAGDGVDLDALLQQTDQLAAICLTHAHLDHYAELTAAHRDDAPIVTSPATAAVLDDVLDIAGVEYNVETTDAVADAITPVDDWIDVAPGIDVHPVPAGHIPGAVGFLVRATDGDQSHHILATGDFTRRRVGGFPGFDAEGFVDIDVLFLTAATYDDFERGLTGALGTALEHAHGGAPTLVTTSGIVGVHIAYLLSSLAAEYDLRVPIRVVGHVAKLYEALDYDRPGVETIPHFQNTDECLEPGAIVIAGPEIPSERSSGRLFGVLRENPNACVVQIVGSGEEPLSEATCTIHDYELSNHPSRETLIDIHDTLDPTQTVITHRHGGAQGAFNDLSSVVWGAGDTDEYTLFDGRRWKLPPWMPGRNVSQTHSRSLQQIAGADLLAEFSVPALDRSAEPNLEAEGLDEDRIATLLHQNQDGGTSLDAPEGNNKQPAEQPDSRTDSTTMATDNTDSTGSSDSTTDAKPPTGLIRTAGADLDVGLDPALQAALSDGSLATEDLTAALTAQKRLVGQDTESNDENEERDEGDSATAPENGGAKAEDTDEEFVEFNGEDGDGPETASEDGATEVLADGAAEGVYTTEEPTDETSSTEPPETTNSEVSEPDTNTSLPPGSELHAAETKAAIVLDLNPVAVTLAERAVEEMGDDSDPVDAAIVAAVDQYIAALLAGEASGCKDERFTVSFDGSRAVERALTTVVDEHKQFESPTDLVTNGLASLLGSDSSGVREVSGLGVYRQHLNAIAANEAYVFNEVAEIVEAAIAWTTVTVTE
ncbi:MBL fold metallo-hydrolase [Natronorubrum tibetense]|uniref:Beta-lactamase fold class-like exonuclease n=1 Tax=Natronorubrum tibetense GA33 TaxID=1114856 RepID=L9VRP1_9EURY|nr:MBL fold metallo-hydrolase [Natronorubrum tibetense]ELY39870.1 beta-lactamase fold class-like exonuclease [Natronorubrum tibetense GA33]